MGTNNQFYQLPKRFSILIILIVFMFNSCKDVGVDFNETLSNPIVNSEELKIYGLVLEQINTNSLIVIADTTMIMKADGGFSFAYTDFIDDYPALQKVTHDAFINPLNKRRVFKDFPNDIKHDLVLLSRHSWPNIEFGAKGLVRFSNIAFNKNRTQALLAMEYYNAPYSGKSQNVVLEKQNKEWKIIKNFNISLLG